MHFYFSVDAVDAAAAIDVAIECCCCCRMLLLLIGLLLLPGAAAAEAVFASSAMILTTWCLLESMTRRETCMWP